MRRAAATIVCTAGLMSLVACGSAGAAHQPTAAASDAPTPNPASQQRSITTQGVGLAIGAPDTATVVLSVQTSAATANGALAENNGKTAAVIESFKGKGVAAKDLQTTGLSLQPNYDPKGATITGYQVSDTITATLRDLAGAGAVIDAAAGAAADAARLQQINFSIGDDTALLDQARTRAITQAKAQAASMAKAAGVSLGAVRSVTETPQGGEQIDAGQRYPAAVPSAAAAVPIQAGSQQLSVTVTLVYDIGA